MSAKTIIDFMSDRTWYSLQYREFVNDIFLNSNSAFENKIDDNKELSYEKYYIEISCTIFSIILGKKRREFLRTLNVKIVFGIRKKSFKVGRCIIPYLVLTSVIKLMLVVTRLKDINV